jgi:hypothetical protein
MFQREITHYIVRYEARIDNKIVLAQHAASQFVSGVVPNPHFARDPLHAIATIELYGGGGEERLATIAFYYTDHGRGSSYEPDMSPPVSLAYSIDRFSDIIGILRQEKPVSVVATNDSVQGVIAYLETKYEPVGEQEGA